MNSTPTSTSTESPKHSDNRTEENKLPRPDSIKVSDEGSFFQEN